MRHLTMLVTALFALVCSLRGADRAALVIGNAGYQGLPRLPACERDAKLIGEIFSTKLGIRLHGGKPLADLTASQMDDALHAFAASLGPDTEAYVYYSGHGVQSDGVNYLLPVDYSAKYKVQLRRQAVSLDDVLSILEESRAKLRVIILDSCRSPGEFLPGEPGEKGFSRKGGLAEQHVDNPDTLVCFATKHGTPAFSPDSTDLTSTSLYTGVLAQEILKPGKIEDVLKEVAIGVYAKTEHRQLPFTYGSLLHNFSFLPGGASVIARLTPERGMPPAAPGPAPVAPSGKAGAVAGERLLMEIAPGVSMPFRWCPPGSFTMGSPESEHESLKAAGKSKEFYSDEVQHRVTLTKGFWLAETVVTQGQWESVMGSSLIQQADKMLADDSLYKSLGNKTLRAFVGSQKGEGVKHVGIQSDQVAMYYVNWADADEFCSKASLMVAHSTPGMTVRLPTEAEWEYACRAGTEAMTYAGNITIKGENNAVGLDEIAWYGGNSSVGYDGKGWPTAIWKEKQYPGGSAGPRYVGTKKPNGWGLHDMIGNVWQWCGDYYGPYTAESSVNPTGPMTGSLRVFRGGSWDTSAARCRAANRTRDEPGLRDFGLGFRPALVPSR